MKRDVHYLAALDWPHLRQLDDRTGEYIAECVQFMITGRGKNPQEADADMREKLRFRFLKILSGEDAVISATRLLQLAPNEQYYKRVWDAAQDALLEAAEEVGIEIVSDGSEDVLTLLRAILEKHQENKKFSRFVGKVNRPKPLQAGKH